MGDSQFCQSFLEDHIKWIKDLIEYYSGLQKDNTEEEKWKSLVMVDYKSLEAARNHLEIVKN